MRKLFKPASLLFYFFAIVLFFVLGLFVAKFVGAGKGQMLAGGAIVLFYGIVSAGIGGILAVFVAYSIEHSTLVKMNKVLAVVFIVLVCLGIYKFKTLGSMEDPINEYPKKPTATAISKTALAKRLLSKIWNEQEPEETSMGIGFFKPNYFENPTLYFYGGVNLEKGLIEHLPVDSVVFSPGKYEEPGISYAPPWLYPVHLKIDYGIIIFKVNGIGYDFVNVEGNRITQLDTYLDKNKGTFISWPEFLMSVNSVEFNPKSAKKVYIRPFEYADEAKIKFALMQPLLVEEEWMYVRCVNNELTEQGKGWIRWKRGDALLITYSLLS